MFSSSCYGRRRVHSFGRPSVYSRHGEQVVIQIGTSDTAAGPGTGGSSGASRGWKHRPALVMRPARRGCIRQESIYRVIKSTIAVIAHTVTRNRL